MVLGHILFGRWAISNAKELSSNSLQCTVGFPTNVSHPSRIRSWMTSLGLEERADYSLSVVLSATSVSSLEAQTTGILIASWAQFSLRTNNQRDDLSLERERELKERLEIGPQYSFTSAQDCHKRTSYVVLRTSYVHTETMTQVSTNELSVKDEQQKMIGRNKMRHIAFIACLLWPTESSLSSSYITETCI